ncbi:hypothetical protein H7J86_05480 [Mycobacterium hackensackense]|uniref:hypothetical protein n=1 Tax=Mycobacterium hackensackense TaxID=228909 RepID=UPI0022658E8E|nr:hypothetical protein [Mycobacterium hackensackense]MCV7251607.1 hypothetical protein [Mycobacterium hackensackense]
MNEELIPRPAAAAWQRHTASAQKMTRWIAAEAGDAAYARRALFLPLKNSLTMAAPAIQAFSKNGNIGTSKSPHVNKGGAVLAYCTDAGLLARAVAAAEGQVLGVIEWTEGEVAGWAAATGAIDLATGEPTPGVPEEIHEALSDLYDAGYQGYHKDRDPYNAAHYFPPIDVLLDAGYDYMFVASYLVALGMHGESVGADLKQIYVPPGQRRRVSR